MDKLHLVLAKLHVVALYPVIGVPLWIVALIGTFPVVDQLVKRAGWTTARSFVELAARALLKSPLLGASLALIPLLGTILHTVANDESVPPTLAMRVKAAMSPKDPPTSKPPGASGNVPTAIGLILCFASLGAFFTVPSCNTLSGKAATAAGRKCETSMLPAEEQAAEVEVVALLSDPVGWETGLLTLAAQIGKAQVTCLVQVAAAGVNALLHPPTDGGATLTALSRATSGPNIIAVNAAAWIAKHGGEK